MHHDSFQQGLRQRIAQVWTWLRGRAQTREPYTQRARQQADGYVRGQQDPDATQRQTMQHREDVERHQHHQRGRGHGR